MNLGVDIDGVLADDDTYRVDHIAKFCYEHGLPEMENPNAYEQKCNWTEEILERYRQEYFFTYIRNAPARAYSAEILTKKKQKGNLKMNFPYMTLFSKMYGSNINRTGFQI